MNDNINDSESQLSKDSYSSFRRGVARLVSWRLSLMVITINCVTLSLADPCDVECQQIKCVVLQIIEHFIFAFFTLEMVLKIIGFGLFGTKQAYLADTWNILDSIIVIVGTCEYAFSALEINFSVIRAIRVIRPLRAIKRIPSLRLLVALLIDIMPMLANVLVFSGFLFFFFGIVAVQLWAGIFRQRCFLPKSFTEQYQAPPDYIPLYYWPINTDYICSTSFGSLTCEDVAAFENETSAMCQGRFSDDEEKVKVCRQYVGLYAECRPDADNPAWGYINFDNIGYAGIAIFQVISLEGWSTIMYLVQDSYSFWMCGFFILLVMLGSYLAVNLCLVVIAAQFTETKARDKKYRFRSAIASVLTTPGSTDGSALYLQLLGMLLDYASLALTKLSFGRINLVRKRKQKRTVKSLRDHFFFCPVCKFHPATANDTTFCPHCFRNLEWVKPSWWTIAGSRLVLIDLFETNIVICLVTIAILFNAIVMAIEHYGQPKIITVFIEYSNMAFTIIFLIELVLKCYAYGLHSFFSDGFNALDSVVVAINVAELFTSNGFSGLSVLRLFRLLRIVRIIRFLPRLQFQILVMLRTVDSVAGFFVLLGFFLYIASLLGLSLFGCKFCTHIYHDDHDEHTAAMAATSPNLSYCNIQVLSFDDEDENSTVPSLLQNSISSMLEQKAVNLTNSTLSDSSSRHCLALFDDIWQSLFTVLQILTQDNWAVIMYDGMRFTSPWVAVYFIAIVTIGNYIIFNLLMAILVDAFSSNSQEDNTNSNIKFDSDSSLMSSSVSDPWRRLSRVSASTLHRERIPSKISIYLQQFREICWASNRSLFIFERNGKLRRWLKNLFRSQYYDRVIISVVLGNCVLIMAERPGIANGSVERTLLTIGSVFFCCLFAIEAVAKIIAHGLLFSPKSYLRSGWNAIDLILVCVAVIQLSLDQLPLVKLENHRLVVEGLRIICLLQALRPIRVASRSHGLRIMIHSLLISIKPIGNILLICLFFFCLFAILGIQLFSGCYASCDIPEANKTSVATVTSKADCLAQGFSWQKEGLNFDNLPSALITLFVFATLDGWTDITLAGVACVAADKQPITNYNRYAYVYFISFLLIVCFFVLNMFVGVVVKNFNSVQRQFDTHCRQKTLRKQMEAVLNHLARRSKAGHVSLSDIRHVSARLSVTTLKSMTYLKSYSEWRLVIYEVVTHKYFEYAVSVITFLNVLLMAVEHYMMPKIVRLVIMGIGYVFIWLILIEMILKIVAYGVVKYVKKRWNQLDIIIVIFSVGGALIENFSGDYTKINHSFIRAARAFRIIRVFKLLKSAVGMRQLVMTIAGALPRCFHLFSLFFLLFFVYSSLGVQLYGTFTCDYSSCWGLSRHANFKNFGMAMLTLFRIFTGDNWNDILNDILTIAGDPERCLPDNSRRLISCGTIYLASPIYFVSFVLLAQFILINIVVAVLMQNLQKTTEEADDDSFETDALEKMEMLQTLIAKRYNSQGLFHLLSSATSESVKAKCLADPDSFISVVSAEYLLHLPVVLAMKTNRISSFRSAPVLAADDMSVISSGGTIVVRSAYNFSDTLTEHHFSKRINLRNDTIDEDSLNSAVNNVCQLAARKENCNLVEAYVEHRKPVVSEMFKDHDDDEHLYCNTLYLSQSVLSDGHCSD